MTRKTKRGIIIAIYVGIVLSIIGGIWWHLRPVPTCIDGKKNGDETAVDCGGSCGACADEITAKDLIVEDVNVVFGGVGRYDVVARIKNPNPLYGGARVRYTITLRSGGKALATKIDETFILPTQERYVIALNIPAATPPQEAVLTINDVSWVRFDAFVDPDFVVEDEVFGLAKESTNYFVARGLVRNKSIFDFAQVDVYAIIKDAGGKPIAVNATRFGNVESGEARDFTLSWRDRFPGVPAQMDVGVYANVYDAQNFVEKYLPDNPSYHLVPSH